ncbi:hypothetical protein CFP56_011225 [Quercus suber]|uniref:Uncharacterized protein n=1 Tax=Quercus suber TaxID=58331 RepID=A0AAW0MCP9_QUESU
MKKLIPTSPNCLPRKGSFGETNESSRGILFLRINPFVCLQSTWKHFRTIDKILKHNIGGCTNVWKPIGLAVTSFLLQSSCTYSCCLLILPCSKTILPLLAST